MLFVRLQAAFYLTEKFVSKSEHRWRGGFWVENRERQLVEVAVPRV